MQLFFIRHGQSENNALWDRTGSNQDRSTDPELTKTGILQAEHLAQYLGRDSLNVLNERENSQNQYGFGITHLYSSLMIRAVATGTIISTKINIPLHGWIDIHEIGGIYQMDDNSGERAGLAGHNRDYFNDNYPVFNLPEEVNPNGWWDYVIENYDDAHIRAKRVLLTLMKKHGGTEDKVAIISHAGFYNVLMNQLLDSLYSIENENSGPSKIHQPEIQHWFILNNTAITRINILDTNIELVYLNRTQFLPNDLIT